MRADRLHRGRFQTNLPEEQGTEFEKIEHFQQFLLGFTSEADTQFGFTDKNFLMRDASWFVTDDWRVSRNLVVNLGDGPVHPVSATISSATLTMTPAGVYGQATTTFDDIIDIVVGARSAVYQAASGPDRRLAVASSDRCRCRGCGYLPARQR